MNEADIKKCLQLIEERLNWGSHQNWANYDFEKLGLVIEEKTGVMLSINTLKRIWGKIKYDHSPTLTTLNTLARFLDFDDWRSFTKSIKVEGQQVPPPQPEISTTENKTGRKLKSSTNQ